MPIFRYTFKKILISPSTWIIFALTLIVLGFSWILPIALTTNSGAPIEWTKDLVLVSFLSTWKLITFSSFIGLMLLIFIAVKATQIFRDEIDDGTLLILVSKPISRNRIWTEKWLSFQATIISYIFLSIFLVSLLLVFPRIGGPVFYLAFLPYMGILFGISLLFDLIFTSIVLLISLALNGKATIAITIGFAALINIFAQLIEPLVMVPGNYYQASHAAAVFHDFEKKSTTDEINWFEEQLNNQDQYQTDIKNILLKVYQEDISNVNYPSEYDPILEQIIVPKIIAHDSSIKGQYSPADIALLQHIIDISGVFRQWKEQSYQELMTSIHVGPGSSWNNAQPGENGVNYSAYDLMQGITLAFDQSQIDFINTKIVQKKVMRYFNVFYQLYYLWNGAWGDTNTSLYINDNNYMDLGDPYLISFNKVSDDNYQVNPNSGNNKIISFPALVTFYVVLGTVLLGTSWYVFNRRDFA